MKQGSIHGDQVGLFTTQNIPTCEKVCFFQGFFLLFYIFICIFSVFKYLLALYIFYYSFYFRELSSGVYFEYLV